MKNAESTITGINFFSEKKNSLNCRSSPAEKHTYHYQHLQEGCLWVVPQGYSWSDVPCGSNLYSHNGKSFLTFFILTLCLLNTLALQNTIFFFLLDIPKELHGSEKHHLAECDILVSILVSGPESTPFWSRKWSRD